MSKIWKLRTFGVVYLLILFQYLKWELLTKKYNLKDEISSKVFKYIYIFKKMYYLYNLFCVYIFSTSLSKYSC